MISSSLLSVPDWSSDNLYETQVAAFAYVIVVWLSCNFHIFTRVYFSKMYLVCINLPTFQSQEYLFPLSSNIGLEFECLPKSIGIASCHAVPPMDKFDLENMWNVHFLKAFYNYSHQAICFEKRISSKQSQSMKSIASRSYFAAVVTAALDVYFFVYLEVISQWHVLLDLNIVKEL